MSEQKWERNCPVCKKDFVTNKNNKVFHSYECMKKYHELIKAKELIRLTSEERALRGELLVFKRGRTNGGTT